MLELKSQENLLSQDMEGVQVGPETTKDSSYLRNQESCFVADGKNQGEEMGKNKDREQR